jgi:hypothetical protein
MSALPAISLRASTLNATIGKIGTELFDRADVTTDGHSNVVMAMPQAHNSILHYLAKPLHDRNDDITHEPLPQRWLDLIRQLNEKEQTAAKAHQPEAEPEDRPPTCRS